MDNETRKSGSASTPVLRLCEVLNRAFPDKCYDIDLSHDENVYYSGMASVRRFICSIAKDCLTVEELVEELNSRFPAEEPMEGNDNVFCKKAVDSRR